MKLTLRIIAFFSFILAIIWFFVQPGFEPLLAFLTGLTTLIISFKSEKEGLDNSKEIIAPITYQILLDHVENFWIVASREIFYYLKEALATGQFAFIGRNKVIC